jgi:hypothetical protein
MYLREHMGNEIKDQGKHLESQNLKATLEQITKREI